MTRTVLPGGVGKIRHRTAWEICHRTGQEIRHRTAWEIRLRISQEIRHRTPATPARSAVAEIRRDRRNTDQGE